MSPVRGGRRRLRAAAVAVLVAAALGAADVAAKAAAEAPRDLEISNHPAAASFAVRDASGLWRALGPDDPAGHAEVALVWSSASPGVELAQTIGGRPGAWQTEVVVVRVDPSRVSLGLEVATRRAGLRGDWTVATAARDAPTAPVLALNAGQFEGGRPWGWLVLDGQERQAPGTGSLTMAFLVDDAGGVHLVHTDALPRWRRRPEVRWAFQSYPMLLTSGQVPEELRGAGRGVDLEHRDIRLALGITHDGQVLIALTRYRPIAGRSLPWGPTVPETAWLMRALGAVDAVMLDGGLSAQLAYDEGGAWTEWPAGRRVPLGLVGVAGGSSP